MVPTSGPEPAPEPTGCACEVNPGEGMMVDAEAESSTTFLPGIEVEVVIPGLPLPMCPVDSSSG